MVQLNFEIRSNDSLKKIKRFHNKPQQHLMLPLIATAVPLGKRSGSKSAPWSPRGHSLSIEKTAAPRVAPIAQA